MRQDQETGIAARSNLLPSRNLAIGKEPNEGWGFPRERDLYSPRSRIKPAEPVPSRPGLDGLLAAVGLTFDEARGAYVRAGAVSGVSEDTQALGGRFRTTNTSHRSKEPLSQEAGRLRRRSGRQA